MTDKIYLCIGNRRVGGFITVSPSIESDVQWQPGTALPFPDNSVDAIVHEGFIDGLDSDLLLPFLTECRRVLKPSAIMRIASADLADRVSSYNESSEATVFMSDGRRAQPFDETRLTRLLERAGLVDIVRRPRSESPHDYLANLELESSSTLVMEARKAARARAGTALTVTVVVIGPSSEDAVHHALAQGLEDLEVLVVGESKDQRVRSLESLEDAIGAASGEFIKVLHSSARLESRCLEKQAAVLRKERDVSLVTSHRRHLGPEHKPLKDTKETRRIVGEPSIIPGLSAAQALLQREIDFIGSPAGVMFRRRDIEAAAIPLLENGDHIVAWLALLARGDLAYLPETLSTAPRIPGPSTEQWQRAQQFAFEAGLWHPAGPHGVWPRPLFPIPWWQQRTTEAVKNVLHCLERGDFSSARDAVVARADEDAFDPVVALLEAELGASEFGREHTIERITTLLRDNEWYVPAQMRLIRFLADAGSYALADDVLEALHSLVPIVEFGSGFEHANDAWLMYPNATLHQAGGCIDLALTIQVRRPDQYTDRAVVIRAALDSECVGEWIWEPGVGAEQTLRLELPPSQRARSVVIEWDAVAAPFESRHLVPLELTQFEVSLCRPQSERATA
ncbi:MAG: methyltransferase domain-containing protein [Myxococcota bacterium]